MEACLTVAMGVEPWRGAEPPAYWDEHGPENMRAALFVSRRAFGVSTHPRGPKLSLHRALLAAVRSSEALISCC